MLNYLITHNNCFSDLVFYFIRLTMDQLGISSTLICINMLQHLERFQFTVGASDFKKLTPGELSFLSFPKIHSCSYRKLLRIPEFITAVTIYKKL